MKKLGFVLVGLLVLGLALPAMGAEFTFNGDLNNRFTAYTEQSGFYAGAGEQSQSGSRRIADDGVSGHWGDIKYRMWTTASTNDGAVKGVYAIELGGLHFGKDTVQDTSTVTNPDGHTTAGTAAGKGKGGNFSGDGVNIETRWAYVDFQIPFIDSKSRWRIGLQPFKINHWLWQETAMGILWYGGQDIYDYELAWIRGFEHQRTTTSGGESVDSFLARLNVKPMDELKVGGFVLYTNSNGPGSGAGTVSGPSYQVKRFSTSTTSQIKLDLWNLGIDGSYTTDLSPMQLFANWDLIYQGGSIDNVAFSPSNIGTTFTGDVDVSAYFLHLDAGLKWDEFKLTYSFFYASGDDDPADDDFEGFVSYDVDHFHDAVLWETLDDDNYFTERTHFLDKGIHMHKLALDYQATDKLKLSPAILYILAAEDIEYTSSKGSEKEDEIGWEIMGRADYKLYKNLTLSILGGYLFAGDAMDFWEEDSIRDGSSDEDIYRTTAAIRYKF